jgi:hypothetical protein
MQSFNNRKAALKMKKYLHHCHSQLKVRLTLKEGQGTVLGLEPI